MNYDDPAYYINRELSWLSFNQRVLGEACDPANPLLERFKFLGIVSSNLDEFFMVRVAGLLQLIEAGITQTGADGLTPTAQLEAILEEVRALEKAMQTLLVDDLLPRLHGEGVHLLLGDEARRAARAEGRPLFEQDLMPVLTPMAIDPAHPFPMLLNNTIYQLVRLEGMPEGKMPSPRHVVIQLPTTLPRFVRLEDRDGMQRFILLGDVMRHNLDRLYPEATSIFSARFRIMRDSDFSIDEEGAGDLLKAIESELNKRKLRATVRLECDAGIDDEDLNLLLKNLELPRRDVAFCSTVLDMSAFILLGDIVPRADLKFPARPPLPSLPELGQRSIFDLIRERDRVIHHPYESFESVEQLVAEAANDRNVLAIKQTLYRTSSQSPIIDALERASLRGKHVTVLVELKARFDEERNIEWARRLENAGAHVIYGLVGYKTHCKVLLIVRRDPDGIRRYLHLGTGNYNSRTARLYTDLGLLTCRPELGAEVSDLFNVLTGYTRPGRWNLISAAPLTLRKNVLLLIRREAENARRGHRARIIAKMNSLVDPETIEELYKASAAGVEIDLIVRGTCCLRPGLPGVSERIRVRSIVGRYLEHARIFYFENVGKEEVHLGSADWMPRNFDRRIELMFPILDPENRALIREILDLQLRDNVKAHVMASDGSYGKPVSDVERVHCHEEHYELARRRLELIKNSDRGQQLLFTPATAPR